MRFSKAILASLFFASTIFATAIPQPQDDSATTDVDIPSLDDGASSSNNTTVIEDGTPDFDPLELTTDESSVVQERSFEANKDHIEARNAVGNKIVACAKSYKGTKYAFGHCKPNPPFGPSNGMDCSCLSRTCIKKGTGTTIPRTTKTQYPSKAGKCHQVARGSSQPGDLIFFGCGTKEGIHHVGIISTKKGYLWHAPKTGDVVKEAKIWTSDVCPKVVRCF